MDRRGIFRWMTILLVLFACARSQYPRLCCILAYTTETMAALRSAMFAAMASTIAASIQDPEISPRPPMGFNNWARFQCNLNETLFTKTADAMVAKGLLAAGYNHINLDDCWHVQTGRNARGELEWNSTLFPHGMPWLGDYLHERGFNFGSTSSRHGSQPHI